MSTQLTVCCTLRCAQRHMRMLPEFGRWNYKKRGECNNDRLGCDKPLPALMANRCCSVHGEEWYREAMNAVVPGDASQHVDSLTRGGGE